MIFLWIPVAFIGLLTLAIVLHPRWLVSWLAGRQTRVLFHVPTDRRLVAMTIDDGPHPDLTPAILDTLRDHAARATFFMPGREMRANPDLVRRTLDEGHELANHLERGLPSVLVPLPTFRTQLAETDAVLREYTQPVWFRPASGWITPPMLAISDALGYRCCLASIIPDDTKFRHTGFLSNQILRRVYPGSIIVLHDGERHRRRTVEVLDRVLPELAERGYQVVSVSELVERA